MKSMIGVLTYRRVEALIAMMNGMAGHCSQYTTVISEDCGQRDKTADVLQQNRTATPRPDLMAIEYQPNPISPETCYFPNAQVFMGQMNLGVAGNSNRILKIFMDSPCDHLCLCNDDLYVTGDFVEYYAKAHQDLEVGMFCFCVAGDTPLLVKNGITTLRDAANKPAEIWNGKKWATVNPIKTGTHKKLYRVKLSDGSYLDCTDDHRFSVKTRFENSFRQVMAGELMRLRQNGVVVQCEPTAVSRQEGESCPDAYTIGFAVGDGHKAEVTNSAGAPYKYVHIYLYGAKEKCPVRGKRYLEKDRVRVVCDSIDPEWLQILKNVPESLDAPLRWNWDRESILNFIAGWADADGANTASGGIRITLSQEKRAHRLQLLLTAVGIRSSVGLDQKAGSKTNYGSRTKDQYYVQITDCKQIPCHRLDTSKGHAPRFKSKYQTIRSVVPLSGLHDVYCFTEPEQHKGLFANVLTHQCDFTEKSPAISGAPETYKWTVYPWRGYSLKFLPRFTGIMMSVTRALVEKIGYFDAIFGKFGEEHCDYTIRARMAGGIRLNNQDMNCLDVEHKLLKHQDVTSSMVGIPRQRADREASLIMQEAGRTYNCRNPHRPFRLFMPRNAAGYSGGGLRVQHLLDSGYALVSDVQQ